MGMGKTMKAFFTSFSEDDNWVKGTVETYCFEAKLFDDSSTFGIDNGRVSKLSIWDEKIRNKLCNFLKHVLLIMIVDGILNLKIKNKKKY